MSLWLFIALSFVIGYVSFSIGFMMAAGRMPLMRRPTRPRPPGTVD